jgi:glycosyltransferase involved in cell wall biosynthesis
MTDQEIFHVAKAAKLTSPTDTVESVVQWRGNADHPVTRMLRIRFGEDIDQPYNVQYPKGRVGIAHICFNAIGGTETWTRQFVRYMLGVSGIATLDRPAGSIGVPLYHGDNAIRALCRASQTVLVWGITDLHKHLFEPRPKKLIAVCHGAPNSRWACEVFENQLRWCDYGVAVHPGIAEKYNVPWIPNIVQDLGSVMREWPPPLRRVAWIHRPSSEKRPELAIEIAKYLHRDCKLMATLGEGWPPETLHDKVTNIGIITDPAKRKIVLEASDVFLATPTDEGFGYSVAEAVERMIPVVSSPHGIATEFAEIQLSTDEPAEWAEAIKVVQRTMPITRLAMRRDRLLQTYGAERVRKLWDIVL